MGLAELRDGPSLLELFGIAVAQGFRLHSEVHLQQFVRAALYCADTGKTAALFSWVVNRGRYDLGTIAHDERARKMIQIEIHGEPIQRPAEAYQP